jgi:hypothetical protein
MAIGLGPWRWIFFCPTVSLHLVQNTLPFPVSTAKLNDDLWTNWRSTVTSSLCFAYSFVSLYYDFYSTDRRSVTNIKRNLRKCLLLVLRLSPASPIGAVRASRFTWKRRVQLWIAYFTNTNGATQLELLDLLFQNSPISWAVLTGNR